MFGNGLNEPRKSRFLTGFCSSYAVFLVTLLFTAQNPHAPREGISISVWNPSVIPLGRVNRRIHTTGSSHGAPRSVYLRSSQEEAMLTKRSWQTNPVREL